MKLHGQTIQRENIMNTQWLAKVADLLEQHHDNGVRFDLRDWIDYDAEDDIDAWCGTKACACGLAASDPEFIKAGFTLSGRMIIFNGNLNWTAVKEFFDLDYKDAQYLFSDNSYPDKDKQSDAGARVVAKRIREFIASK